MPIAAWLCFWVHRRKQGPKCELCKSRLRHLNRGEGWHHEAAEADIVEPHDRDVFGNAQLRLVCLPYDSDRSHVVRANHRGRLVGDLAQLRESRHPAFHRVVTFDNELSVSLEPKLSQRCDESSTPLHCAGKV